MYIWKMPQIKRSRKSRRTARKGTRKAARSSRRKQPLRRMSWNGSPFPREMTTQFTYAQSVIISSAAGVPATQAFSTNSLFDPDVTGVGHQPRFYDTLVGGNQTVNPYNMYRVYSSKITIEGMVTTDSISARGFLGLGFFSSSQTSPSTLQEMRERSDYKTRYMGIYTGGKELCKMKRSGANKFLWGIKDMKDDEETAALYNSSPVKAGRWAITYIPFDEASNASMRLMVKIVYTVVLFNLNDVSDS